MAMCFPNHGELVYGRQHHEPLNSRKIRREDRDIVATLGVALAILALTVSLVALGRRPPRPHPLANRGGLDELLPRTVRLRGEHEGDGHSWLSDPKPIHWASSRPGAAFIVSAPTFRVPAGIHVTGALLSDGRTVTFDETPSFPTFDKPFEFTVTNLNLTLDQD
jgi:hypothetical protein